MEKDKKDRVDSQKPRVIEQSIVELDGREFTRIVYSQGVPEGANILFPDQANQKKFQPSHQRIRR